MAQDSCSASLRSKLDGRGVARTISAPIAVSIARGCWRRVVWLDPTSEVVDHCALPSHRIEKVSVMVHLNDKSIPSPRGSSEDPRPSGEMVKRIVATYSRGNVSLQLGCYLTEADVDARRKSISTHKF